MFGKNAIAATPSLKDDVVLSRGTELHASTSECGGGGGGGVTMVISSSGADRMRECHILVNFMLWGLLLLQYVLAVKPFVLLSLSAWRLYG